MPNSVPQAAGEGHVKELLTSAASQIRQQGISAVAAALVAALRVGAEGLTAAVLDGTLVDVWRRTETPRFRPQKNSAKTSIGEWLLTRTHRHIPLCSRWICNPCHRRTGSGRSCWCTDRSCTACRSDHTRWYLGNHEEKIMVSETIYQRKEHQRTLKTQIYGQYLIWYLDGD